MLPRRVATGVLHNTNLSLKCFFREGGHEEEEDDDDEWVEPSKRGDRRRRDRNSPRRC